MILAGLVFGTASTATAQVTAIRAGRLVDPEAGTIATDQIILVEGGTFQAIGADVAIPSGAEVIDLSELTIVPGLVDAHNHLALTYKEDPESNVYYLTYVMESTALRAIQASSNGSRCCRRGSRSSATWATTGTTPTRRFVRPSSRGGFRGP